MPCLIVLVVFFFPRIVLAVPFFTTNYLQRAYHNLLLLLVGFLFLPLTTLVYAWLVNTRSPMDSFALVVLVIAIVIDLGGIGGGEYHRRSRL
jgi:hypothetical protein